MVQVGQITVGIVCQSVDGLAGLFQHIHGEILVVVVIQQVGGGIDVAVDFVFHPESVVVQFCGEQHFLLGFDDIQRLVERDVCQHIGLAHVFVVGRAHIVEVEEAVYAYKVEIVEFHS